MSKRQRCLGRVLCAAVLGWVAGPTLAANFTWDGGGANNNWGTAANWNPDGAPPTSGGGVLTFSNASGRNLPNLETNYTIDALSFPAASGSFNIGSTNASTLTLTSNGQTFAIADSSISTQTISASLILANPQTWHNATAALNIFSPSVNLNGNNLTLDAPTGGTQVMNTILSDTAAGSTASVNKTGGGTVTFAGSGADTFSGSTNISAGLLILAKTGAANSAVKDLAISNNAAVKLNVDEQIADSKTVTLSETGTLLLNARTETITSLNMTGGTVDTQGGVLRLLGDSSISSSTGDPTLTGAMDLTGGTRRFTITTSGKPVDLTVNASLSNGSITFSGPLSIASLSGSGVTNLDNVSVGVGGSLLLNRTGMDAAVSKQLNVGEIGVSVGTAMYLASNQIADAATVVVSRNSTLNLNGFSDAFDTLKPSMGAHVLTGNGTLSVVGSITTTVDPGINVFGPATIAGKLNLIGPSGNSISVTGPSAVSTLAIDAKITSTGLVQMSGTGGLRLRGDNTGMTGEFQLFSGQLFLGSPTAVGTGTFSVLGGTIAGDTEAGATSGPLNLNRRISLLGQVTFTGDRDLGFTGIDGSFGFGSVTAQLSTGHTLSITTPSTVGNVTVLGGTLNASLLTATQSFQFNNGGVITLTPKIFAGTLDSKGVLDYANGTFSGRLINEGTIKFVGDMVLGNGMLNLVPVTVTGTLGNIVANGQGLDNQDSITLSSGSISGTTLANNGLMTGTGAISSTGGFVNNGQLTPVGGAITLSGAAATNAANVTVDSGTALRANVGLTNLGTISLNAGSINGTGSLVNSGGTISGHGNISIPVSNAGTIDISGGALTLVADFASSGLIRLNGGASLAGFVAGRNINISNAGQIRGDGSINASIDNHGRIEPAGTLTLNDVVTANADGLIAASTGNTVLFTTGLASNAGTISLAGGTLDNNGHDLANSGQLTGSGTIRARSLTNNGSVTLTGGLSTVNADVVNNTGHKMEVRFNPAIFTGLVTNKGVFKNTASVVTFAGGYVEQGTFSSDPADNYYSTASIGSTGVWMGGAGDRFHISGSLYNSSTANTSWNTDQAQLLFETTEPHYFLLSGQDLGASYSGYENNFAWGTLTVSDGPLILGPSFPQETPALYVHRLDLPGGIAQFSQIVGNGINIYYDRNDPANAYLNAQVYALPNGGAAIPVPEPASLALVMGCAPLLFVRRRHRHARNIKA